jgi:hypothetical protein
MLPIYADPEDMEEVISYLQTKATGVSLEEARATIEERLLDNRKLSGYGLCPDNCVTDPAG